MRSSISRGCRSLGNGNRSAVTGGLGPAHVRRESRGAPRLPSGVCVSSEENTSLPATPPKRAWGGPKNSRSLCGLIWRTLSPLICPTVLRHLTGWPRDPALSWFSGRPDLRGGFDGICCREEHCGALRPCDFPHASCDAFARRSETQTLRPPGRDRLFFLGFCPTSLRLCASWRRPPWQGDHEQGKRQPSPAARHGGPRPAAGGPRPPARRGCPHATAEALAGDLPASSCPVGIASLGSSRAVEQLY